MRTCIESGIEFDFSRALSVFEHDTKTPTCDSGTTADGNTGWPGVDFRLECIDGWVWLEVKHWRGSKRGRFYVDIMSREFAAEMRGKFLGTTAHLAWNGAFALGPVRYILLFEPPQTTDIHLLGPFQDLVRKQMSVAGALPVQTFVMSVAGAGRIDGWNDVFKAFPARKL